MMLVILTREGEAGKKRRRRQREAAPAVRDYFLMPRSDRASLALAMDSLCLPSSCSFWASSSLATAPFTFGSSAFILAAASRPSLMSFGHELAIATPVNARLTATIIATIVFFMLWSPPLGARLSRQGSALAPLTAGRSRGFPGGLGVRRRRVSG